MGIKKTIINADNFLIKKKKINLIDFYKKMYDIISVALYKNLEGILMNNCQFTGRFTAAPRRKDSDKSSRCFFTLMVNKEGKKADGTRYPAQPVDFIAWGRTADLICQYKSRGDMVVVTSEFYTYETDAVDMQNQPIPDARKINRAMFTVKHIEFMPSGNKSNNNGNGDFDTGPNIEVNFEIESNENNSIGDL